MVPETVPISFFVGFFPPVLRLRGEDKNSGLTRPTVSLFKASMNARESHPKFGL